MKVDSLEELEAAFSAWRERKKHAREAVPDDLLARAQRAVKRHGVRPVVRVTRFESSRLFRTEARRGTALGATTREVQRSRSATPGFTRLELEGAQAHAPRPLAEIETAAGVRLRVFEGTPEVMGLLSAICRSGDA